MTRALLAIACCTTVLALASIAARLFLEYQRGTLTTKTLLVGGFAFAGLLGLFAAGVQVLAQGPGL
jgi:hypothetical protein